MEKPLKGLRILDLSMWWSGPMCTQYLGALGAEVLKIESVQAPDGFRFMVSSPGENWWELGPQFNSANHNKIGATINLMDEEGRDYLKKLVQMSDVIIENYTVRVMENFGLTYDMLKQYKKDLIMISMPAYGKTGPYRDEPGFAYTFEMLSGIAQLNGYRDGNPMTVLGVADIIGGFHAATAILTAVEYRKRTGKGQEIELAQVEGCLNYMGAPLADYQLNNRNWGRQGNRQPGFAPQGVYRCQGRDVWVAISITNDEEWQTFTQIIKQPELAERYPTYDSRWAAHDEIDEIIHAWTKDYTHYEVSELLQQASIPAGPVLEVHEMENDPFLSNMYQKMERELVGTHVYPSWPIKYNGERLQHFSPAPLLGQDNEYVFKELLGVSEEEYKALEEKKIIGKKMIQA